MRNCYLCGKEIKLPVVKQWMGTFHVTNNETLVIDKVAHGFDIVQSVSIVSEDGVRWTYHPTNNKITISTNSLIKRKGTYPLYVTVFGYNKGEEPIIKNEDELSEFYREKEEALLEVTK